MKRLVELDLPSRSEMIRVAEELRAANAGMLTRLTALRIVVQIIDQMPPKRDARVNLLAWSIAMLAERLCDAGGVMVKVAILAAIETLAPGKAESRAFRENISRVHRKLRAGKNAAANQLLEPPPELVAMAKEKLR